MDAEKWQKIASSFKYTGNRGLSTEVPASIEIASKPPQEPLVTNHTMELKNLASSGRVRGPSSTPRPLENVVSEMNHRIQNLSKLVDEKSAIIQEQMLTISILQRKLELSSPAEHPNPNQVSQSQSKDLKVKNGKRSDSKQNSSDSTKLRKSDSKSASVLPIILNRLENLEKRMDQFTKSLPQKIQIYCEKYISNCKFRYDESGEYLIPLELASQSLTSSSEKKPIWERSPRIKPKVNFSSQIRQRNKLSEQDKESSIPPNYPEGLENYLKQLEQVVTNLKVGFVQLLLQKITASNACKCSAKGENKSLKLDGFRNILQNL